MSVPRKLSPTALVRRLSPRSFAAGFVVAALLVGGGAAFGAIPALTTGKFTACVTTSTGATRIIDYEAGKRCTSAETTVSWSKGWTYRGTWQPAFTYAVGDVAYSNGTSYLAKAPSTNQSPATSPTSWSILASRGATGATCARGPAGPSYAKTVLGNTLFPTPCSLVTIASTTLTPSVQTGVLALGEVGFAANGSPGGISLYPWVEVTEGATIVGYHQASTVWVSGTESVAVSVTGLMLTAGGATAVLQPGHTYTATLKGGLSGTCSGTPEIPQSTLTVQYTGLTP